MDIKINNILYIKTTDLEIHLEPYQYQKGLTIYIKDSYKIIIKQMIENQKITRELKYEEKPIIEIDGFSATGR